MHGINTFGTNPPTRIVDNFLGSAYDVVKKVYLNLDWLKEVHDSEPINWLYENWELVNETVVENYEGLKSLVENTDDLLAVPDEVDKRFTEGTEAFTKQVETSAKELKEYAESAAYSYRYVSKSCVNYEEVPFGYLTPTSNVKVGDHVITVDGDIYDIASITKGASDASSTFTLGYKLTSIKGATGDKGEPGQDGADGSDGSNYSPDIKGLASQLHLYDNEKEGKSFLAMDTGMIYFKLSDTYGDWSEGHEFGRGPEGPEGPQGPEGPAGPTSYVGIAYTGSRKTITLEEDVKAYSPITLPDDETYLVGADSLRLSWNGLTLYNKIEYSEIGKDGESSNQFYLTFDVSKDDIIEAWIFEFTGDKDDTTLMTSINNLQTQINELQDNVVYDDTVVSSD